MPETRVTIASEVGLHARPAATFVQAAAKQACQVSVGREETALVNAKSMLAVLSLALQHGEEVVLRTEGADAEAAIAGLADLLARDLDAVS
ncbi:HPr family phosphocarrier protein [Streptomyces sp. MB09-02B]|uniref:HPr family phosphocarrier protein n=1 Tax=Streptomyces sp. MB09-02B TaxID=3028667 RepID=UPI0029B54A17|nr:HPr family phosphocarrier protein [Streptomyces sp. MB09-02B]MDX3638061.1 HPr family phosphocarrier protein [Streptomyces sp. MB09-02B]